MKNILRGSLCGYLCEDCSEPLSDMEVLLYLPWQKDRVAENALASTKDTFHLVTNEEKENRKDLLVASTKTDANGNFLFELDEKFSNTAFDIDFSCGNVPGNQRKPSRTESLQFHLTTILPQWKTSKDEQSLYYQWQYCITSKWWCYIRGHYFDAWVICGQLKACDTGAVIPGAVVTAWDADFFTDDNLGSAVTDASGHFRIDYTSIQFKQTFLSPWINVETDPVFPPTFNSGPDVYFKAVLGGATIISETSANRRNNVGYCLCVDLCANVEGPVQQPVPVPAFLRIGGIDYETQMHSHVGESGLTNGNYAFFNNLRLNGILSQTLGGAPMEYCFEYTSQYDAAGHPVNWIRVLANLIPQTNIGYVEKAVLMPPDATHPLPWYQYNYANCYVTNSPVGAPDIQVPIDVNGWILVPQQNDNPLNTAGAGLFVSNTNQIFLDSTKIAAFPAIDLTGLTAGNSSTSTGKALASDQVFAIRMLVRQQGSATATEAGRCTRIAIDNTLYNGMLHHPDWGGWGPGSEYGVCMVDIVQLQSAGCTKITNQVDILYTFAHPNLGSVSATLQGPSGTIALPLPPVSPDLPGTIIHTFTAADPLCAYLVTVSATYLLTTGDSNLSSVYDQIAFCR